MALDSIGLAMIAPLVKGGASVLCLGYPDLTASRDEVRELLGIELDTQETVQAFAARVRDLRFATNGTREPVAPQPIEASLSGRGQLQGETVLYALCQKLVDLPLKWPLQACYRRAA